MFGPAPTDNGLLARLSPDELRVLSTLVYHHARACTTAAELVKKLTSFPATGNRTTFDSILEEVRGASREVQETRSAVQRVKEIFQRRHEMGGSCEQSPLETLLEVFAKGTASRNPPFRAVVEK